MPAPSDPNRPSAREICNKVRDARTAIQARRRQAPFQKHLIDDCRALEIDGVEELWDVLLELTQEIINANPLECYAGTHPPTPSYEPEIRDLELWAYCWDSPSARKKMYLKFAMKKDKQANWWYMHLDVHASRPRKEN